MNSIFRNFHKNNWFFALILFIACAVMFLPMIRRLGFYYDDWYMIYDAHTQGAQFLHVVFSIDRPARGYLMAFVYSLFDDNLIYYQLTAFIMRYIGSLAFFLTLNLIWEENKQVNFLIALLFILYPAYPNQIQPVDFLSHRISLCLAMVSIALTIFSFRIRNPMIRLAIWIISTVMGWIYLGLVEHFLGLEFLRLLFIYMMTISGADKFKKKVIKTFIKWLPYAIIPGVFLIWRLFIFNNTRPATDINLQLGVFFQSPILTGAHWGVAMLFSIINSILASWVVPFYNNIVMGGLRLRDIIWILALGTGITSFILLVLYWLKNKNDKDLEEPLNRSWIHQAIWGGVVAVIIGLIPVIIANRIPAFGNAGYYLLASAPAVAMVVVAGIHTISSRRVRIGIIGTIVFLSAITQFGSIVDHVYQADSLRDFWWQVNWRAPQIEKGTTLIASYSEMWAPEEFVIWAPANLIYYPQKLVGNPINLPLPALIPDAIYITRIISQDHSDYARNMRGNMMTVDFQKVLALIQPQNGGCVRIMDASEQELSPGDPLGMMMIAPYSKIDSIIVDTEPVKPPQVIFGPEPEHTWCYYYEKAEMARQEGDWSSVITFEEGAFNKGFSPKDPVEWIPLLQAYVATGQTDKLEPYISIMASTAPLIRNETCQILTSTVVQTQPNNVELQNFVDHNYCP